MTTAVELIAALKAIEEDDSVLSADYLTTNWDEETDTPIEVHPKVKEASNIASDELCRDIAMGDGRYVKAIRDAGYGVFPGETDSFGWLTGCIQTSKGIVVFG